MNNDITVCHYGTSPTNSTTMFLSVVIKANMLARKRFFKVYGFMTANNENKLLCYESYLHKMRFDTISC